jgi:signal transduction histidine kinase
VRISSRLLLWYASITLIAVPFFSAATYFGYRHLMFEALENEQEAIIQAIESRYDPVTKTFPGVDAPELYLNVDMEEAYMVLYDASGRPIYRSPIADKITLSLPMAKDKPELVSIVKYDSERLPVYHPASSEMIRFHAVSHKLFHQGEFIGWVNVASSMDDVDDALGRLWKTLFGAKLIVLLILLGGGCLIVRRSLRPVTAMTAKAREISATNLSERIEVKDPSDEIGQLAMVLNGLLDRLESAFASQQQFMADAAHELKTPIAILRTNWEDELNNPDVPHTFKERLVGDVETITRLSRVINDLLLLSQTDPAARSFRFAPVQLNDLTKDVVSDTEVLAAMKRQKIECGAIEPVVVNGDRDRLYQLIFNLIDNAVKFTPKKGKITVGLGADRDVAVLTVRDTGRGIPQEDLPHIFNRFYRVDEDRSRRTGGSGLGLSICLMIAEAHRGEIRVGSERGKGTLFEVRLPVLG